MSDPEPAAGQVLVRLRSAGLNFIDVTRWRALLAGQVGLRAGLILKAGGKRRLTPNSTV